MTYQIGYPHRHLAVLVLALGVLAGCGAGSDPGNAPPPPPAPAPAPGSTLVVSAYATQVTAGESVQFFAQFDSNSIYVHADWSVSGRDCAGGGCGSISDSGVYLAPSLLSAPIHPTIQGRYSAGTQVFDATFTITVGALGGPFADGVALLMGALPPRPPGGVTVLATSVRIVSASLQPGSVAVPVDSSRFDLNRLGAEYHLLALARTLSGNFTGLTLTFDDPLITIRNDSGAAVAGCPVAEVCTLAPTLAAATLTLEASAQPLVVSSAPGGGSVLLVRVDLSRTLAGLASFTPAASLERLTIEAAGLRGVRVRQVTGPLQFTGGDNVIDGAYFDIAAGGGVVSGDDGSNHYIDAGQVACGNRGYFFCTDGKTADVDFLLTPYWSAQLIVMYPPNQREFEGRVVGVVPGVSVEMILLHQVPVAETPRIGERIHVDLARSTEFAFNESQASYPGARFNQAADLVVGQIISVRGSAATLPAGWSVAADRIRLKSRTVDGEVESVTSDREFVLRSGDPVLGTRVIGVSTDAPLLSVGDRISARGYLFNAATDPVLLIDKIVRP